MGVGGNSRPCYNDGMDAPPQAPLTPEQLAAMQAGGGLARVEDPTTHRVYFLLEQSEPPALDDEYVREKVAEAYSDGNFEPLDMEAVKAEFHRRQATRDQTP
jgi:hypothetical protein